MPPDPLLVYRQIWAIPTPTTTAVPRSCTPFILPSGGLLTLRNDSILTLSEDAVFQPACSGQPATQPVYLDQLTTATAVLDAQEPFYASTSPLIYAIASATIVSYMLVIILFITPRTFIVSGAGGTGGFLGQRSMIAGGSGSPSVIGIGSRPWLQKVAALTVAISLTIATADTFSVARSQYEAGYEDATALTETVVEGLEIRISRVISDTCLWLAQVQTLIRLFTRHKEKVIIKWIGFALIVFDTTFSILNYFVVGRGRTRARRFVDAIPALSYLFALALSLLYAAWVIYYSLSKHRYAFFHPKMRNIVLVAMLALTAVLIPVVFFVLDISQPNVAGWGDYVRWVGAAAASVVVWEWVERIEALERDEKKDGILGREIFDGDEMLQVTPSTEVNGSGARRDIRKGGGRGGQDCGAGTKSGWNDIAGIASRLVGSRMPVNKRHFPRQRNRHRPDKGRGKPKISTANSSSHPRTGPVPVTSPVSREDTTSAASTVYVIHYHANEDPTPPPRLPRLATVDSCPGRGQLEPGSSPAQETENHPYRNAFRGGWQRFTNPFKHDRSSPPLEVAQARAGNREQGAAENPSQDSTIVSRPTSFFDRLRHHNRSSNVDLSSLPRTVIPAPRRGIDILMEAEAEAESARNELVWSGATAPSLASPDYDLSDNTRDRSSMLRAVKIARRASSVALSPTAASYSPTDLRATQLSRRGSLLISEEYSRPSAPQIPGSHSPTTSTPSQRYGVEGSPNSSQGTDDSPEGLGPTSPVEAKDSSEGLGATSPVEVKDSSLEYVHGKQ
ncbi:pH-response regulator protein palH/rim21 [Pseudocyphellaria aurata]|nr:pH-response regulator protein palH/rim21 [Pseudocyphellaria aurata]